MKNLAEKTINKFLPYLKTKTDKIHIAGLPLLFKQLYSFDKLFINKTPYILVTVKDKKLGIRDFANHTRIIREKTDLPIIWYLQKLHFNKIERLIKNMLNFVIQDRQVYLPFLGLSLKYEKEIIQKNTKLNYQAINILIYQIINENLSQKTKIELAKIFNTTQMTMIRALEPLIENGLCDETKDGVTKKINFKNRNELWDYFKKNVKNPVNKIVYLNKLPKHLPLSNTSALAKKTMIADTEIPTYVISKKEFVKAYSRADLTLDEFAKCKLELWDREPMLNDDNTINYLDIYLTCKDSDDERVQIELEKLLLEFNLKI